jgi:hypothetical protein
MSLIQLSPRLYLKLKRLSPAWHRSVNQAIEDYANAFENQFVAQNSSVLYFKHSLTE